MNTTEASPMLKDNHREDGWLAIAILVTTLETIFFALRVIGRRYTNTRWWLDDCLMVLAYLVCIAHNTLVIVITTRTWVGQHTAAVVADDYDEYIYFLKLSIPLTLTYVMASIIPKMAIVAIFTRVFYVKKTFRIVCWVVMALLISLLILGIVVIFTICIPFSDLWQSPANHDAGERCLNFNNTYMALSIPNVLTDIITIILPIPMVWMLQKTRLEKLGILSTFCLGLFSLAFSLARMGAFIKVLSASDALWTITYAGAFGTLETASYFLVSCMITLRQLRHVPFFSKTRKQRGREQDEERRSGSLTVSGNDGGPAIPVKVITNGSQSKTVVASAAALSTLSFE